MLKDKIKSSGRFITGIDVGTTKICVTVGEVLRDGISILSVNSTPSTGLKKGVVIDIDSTVNSIRKALNDAEKLTGRLINEAFVGIAGSHIKSFVSSGSAVIKGKEVTPEDVERALEAAGAVNVPLDREIIQIIPTDFILDGQSGIKDPVGMAGARLNVNTFIITGTVTSIQNLLKCCQGAGLEVKDIILQPLASAEAALTQQERESGIVLIDIGGGTTDIAVYRNNWLRHTAIYGIGGYHFTNDLSVGMKLSFQEAERIKMNIGHLLPASPNENDEVEIITIDGQLRKIPQKYIAEILLPRSEELLELINKEIMVVNGEGISVCGAVLTGGASLLSDFDKLAESILSMPVRIGYPDLISKNPIAAGMYSGSAGHPGVLKNLSADFNHPMYTTGIGLVIYGAETTFPPGIFFIDKDSSSGIINRMTGWFKNILAKMGG